MEEEEDLIKNYGLKSKKEVWRTETLLRDFRRQARKLMAASGEQADQEARQLLDKLQNLGLLGEDSSIVDVLRLDIVDVLDRRLQSAVYGKGLARTPVQARQLINHGHIVVGDRRVTEPGYLVSVEEERETDYHPDSSFKGRFEPEEVRPPETAESAEE